MMKRILTIAMIAVATVATLGSCTTKEEVDKQLETLTNYVGLQNIPGVYTCENGQGKPVYTFNHSDGQGYFNKSKLTYRIMNNDGSKYVQFVLSAEPVVGESVDVKTTVKGIKGLSNSVYKGLKVDRIEDNLLYLVGGATADYTALILVWVE